MNKSLVFFFVTWASASAFAGSGRGGRFSYRTVVLTKDTTIGNHSFPNGSTVIQRNQKCSALTYKNSPALCVDADFHPVQIVLSHEMKIPGYTIYPQDGPIHIWIYKGRTSISFTNKRRIQVGKLSIPESSGLEWTKRGKGWELNSVQLQSDTWMQHGKSRLSNWVSFHPGSKKIWRTDLVAPEVFKTIRGEALHCQSVELNRKGRLLMCDLATPSSFRGYKMEGYLAFHKNGRIKHMGLTAPTKIRGKKFWRGDSVYFDHRGRLTENPY